MTRKYLSLFIGVFLFLVLYRQSLPPGLYLALLFVGIVLTATVNYFSNYLRVTRLADLTFLLISTLWILAAASTVAALGSAFWIMIAAAVFLLGFVRLQLDISPSSALSPMTEIQFFLSVTGIYLGVWAIDFYFSPGWWIIMLLIFALSYLFFRTALHFTSASSRQKSLYSLILAFVFVEIGWVMLFWPLHYFPTTLVFSGFFYIAWITAKLHFLKVLNRQKLIVHAVFILAMQALVLLTAVWLPQV